MVLPAPVTFSTTIGWPSISRMRSLINRASVSGGPPAVVGAMMVIGRDGKLCAAAPPVSPAKAATTIA